MDKDQAPDNWRLPPRRRLVAVAASGAGTLGVPLLTVLVSLLVVRLASVERWGEVVPLLLGVQLAAHVVGWGQKEYLPRAFSRAPAQVAAAWQTSLLTRLPLLAVAGALAGLLGLPAHQWGLVLLWLLGLVLAQAHEPLVVYRRAFGLALAIDLTGLGLVLAAIAGLAALAGGAGLTLDRLLLLFALVQLGKAVTLGLCFRRTALPGWRGRFAPAYFGLALPFFLLGASGLVQSRIDLYCVSAFLPRTEVGHYQLLTSALLALQGVANVVLAPFVKLVYRLGPAPRRWLAGRLFLLGLLLTPAGLALAWLVLDRLYQVHLPPAAFVAGGLAVLPIYAYLPTIYDLYRAERQTRVLAVNGAGIAVTLTLSLLLLPSLGLTGAVTASAAGQWVMLGLYRVLLPRHAIA